MKKNIWILIIAALIITIGFYVLISRQITSSIQELDSEFEANGSQTQSDYNNIPMTLYAEAVELDHKSDSLVKQLETTKELLIDVASVDTDYDLNQPEVNAQIIRLKEGIDKHRTWIETNYPGYVTDVNQMLNTDDSRHNGSDMPWEEKYFHYSPLAAVYTLLTKIQSDVRSIESRILDSLKVEMDKEVLDAD